MAPHFLSLAADFSTEEVDGGGGEWRISPSRIMEMLIKLVQVT